MSSTELYSLTSRVKLNDGRAIPRFGLGVCECEGATESAHEADGPSMMGADVTEPGQETYQAVKWALEAGYRVSLAAQIGSQSMAVQLTRMHRTAYRWRRVVRER